MTANTLPTSGPLDTEQMKSMIPHRYPFLLVDRVLDWESEPERVIRAVKNISVNEPFFQGHFPDNPVMPGVLIIEAMAQAAGVLGALMSEEPQGDNLYYLAKIEEARFSRVVSPGDQLLMTVKELRRKRGMGFFEGVATVDGHRAASCKLVCAGR
jgi:3-hydroxyacyl-[acyl-carrier-protein] dehydratase